MSSEVVFANAGKIIHRFQLDIYPSVWDNALFLFRQEKGQKKPTQGALCVALPRAESVPLCIPRRTYDTSEYLNLHPEHDKNVPIFAVQWFCFRNTAGRRERSSRHQQDRDDVPSRRENVTQFFRCVRVGYTGEVVLRAANRNMSLAGGKRSIVYAICRAAARHECLPLCRLLWLLSCSETRK